MKISSPIAVTKVTGYQPVPGGYPTGIPTKFAPAGRKPGNPVFARLDELLAAYHSDKTTPWGQHAVLGDLYFTTDYALKKCGRKDPAFVPCEADLTTLYRTVADTLCKCFDCSVNILPQKLEDWWGRVLTKHGHDIDTRKVATGAPPTVAQYLTRAEVEKYRLSFASGFAYMRERSLGGDVRKIPKPQWVKANSAGIGWTDGRGPTAPAMMADGYAGFALSMGREFYMAHHRGCFPKANFFHSSYLAGDTVLCTGTILIEQGVVKGVANDSGHYQPSLDHLLNVAQTLRMQGCNLAAIDFHAVWPSLSKAMQQNPPGQTYQYLGQWWVMVNGERLLQLRSGGTGLSDRHAANLANIATRLPKGAVKGVPPKI